MSDLIPPNKNGGRKPSYHKVPAKSKQSSKSGGSKYGMPKKPKIPTPVLVTNILMICVILAICGVVFAITYNNMKYDKADSSKGQNSSAAVSASGMQSSSLTQSSVSQSSAAQSSVPVSTAVSDPVSENSGGESTPTPTGEYDADYFSDALFIGDSIFTGLYGYSYIDRANVAAAVGYTAYGAQVNPFDESYFSGNAVDYAKSRDPKKIIIMLGTNGLSSQTDMDDFETGYRGLLNKLKKECPDSKICAVSVPPITANSSMAEYSGITNTIINNANERIKSICSELDVIYYDVNSVLKDESGYFSEEYAEADGMHFLGATYPVLLSGVQKALEQQ